MLYYLNVIRSTEKRVSLPMKRECVVLSDHKTMALGCWVQGRSRYIQRIRNHHYGPKEEVVMEAYGKSLTQELCRKEWGRKLNHFWVV